MTKHNGEVLFCDADFYAMVSCRESENKPAHESLKPQAITLAKIKEIAEKESQQPDSKDARLSYTDLWISAFVLGYQMGQKELS